MAEKVLCIKSMKENKYMIFGHCLKINLKMKLKAERKYKNLKAPFWIRWAARIVVVWIYKWLRKNPVGDCKATATLHHYVGENRVYVSIDSPYIFGWIMRACGYSVYVADVMEWLDEKMKK